MAPSLSEYLKHHNCPRCGLICAVDVSPPPPDCLYPDIPSAFAICGSTSAGGCAHLYTADFCSNGRPRDLNPAEKAWLQSNPEFLTLTKAIQEATIKRLGLFG